MSSKKPKKNSMKKDARKTNKPNLKKKIAAFAKKNGY
jgi:hypothetical protein